MTGAVLCQLDSECLFGRFLSYRVSAMVCSGLLPLELGQFNHVCAYLGEGDISVRVLFSGI